MEGHNIQKKLIPRFWNVSESALMILGDFGTEADKVQFFDFMYSASRALLAGNAMIEPIESDSKALARAIDYEIAELEVGYASYQQKIYAVQRSREKRQDQNKQDDIDKNIPDSSIIRRPIGDQSAIEQGEVHLPETVIHAMRAANMGSEEFPEICELFNRYYEKDLCNAINQCRNAQKSKLGYLKKVLEKVPQKERIKFEEAEDENGCKIIHVLTKDA